MQGQNDAGTTDESDFHNPLALPKFDIAKDVTSVTGGTADNKADSAGDVINYGIVLTNTGNQSLTGVSLTDAFATTLSDKTESISNNNILDVGETWNYTATHTVSQAEIDAGLILTNVAIAKTIEAGDKSDDATTPVIQNPDYTIVKTATIHDGGNTVDQVGDVIDYNIVLTNTGNITLTGVNLTDKVENYSLTTLTSHTDTGSGIHGDSNLDVGEIWTYSTSYTTVAADFTNNGGGDGDIDNVAKSTTTQIPTEKTATASEPIKAIAPAGAVLQTGTTCDQYLQQYLAGTHTLDINRADYTVQKDHNGSDAHVGSVAPGVVFYYTGASGDLKADAHGDLTIQITQSKVGSFELLDIVTGLNNVKVYQVNDIGTVKGAIDAGDTCTTYNGSVTYTLLNQDGLEGSDGVTIRIDGPDSSAGTMFIASIKVAPNTVELTANKMIMK